VDLDVPAAKREAAESHDDPDYFSLYSSIEIHREMLADRVRTETYRDAIMKNRALINQKVVLDVGMGTGILSYFAAKQGARKVYGVEACHNMAEQVKKIVKHNKLEKQIQVLTGLIENTVVPEPVDVLISEWMGYMLIYESMLDSIIYARDHFLKPGGRMLPSRCRILLMPFCDFEAEDNDREDLGFWDNVYGFDYSPIKPFVKECLTKEPEITMMPPHFQMALTPQCIKNIDCMTIQKEDFGVESNFECKSIITGELHGVSIWFDAEFDTEDSPVRLPTGPEDPETHWCQTMLRLTNSIPTKQDEIISGSISIQKSVQCPRSLCITLSFSHPEKITKTFMFE